MPKESGSTVKAGAGRVPHCVSAFETRDFGAEGIRIGDLNGDGAPDLLIPQVLNLAQPGTKELMCNTREVSCLTATTITGEILWQYGEPGVGNGCGACDCPVQIYDWDNDGENEVLFIRQAIYGELYAEDPPDLRARAKCYEGTATMVVLDGRTGREKTSFPLPAPADDRILFADLTGRGRREDFVLKDGYGENVYGVSRTGELLWHWHGGVWPIPDHNCANKPKVFTHDEKCEAGHCPAIADMDGDGLDEVFFGFALLDHDGQVLFRSDCKPMEHQDASYMVRRDDGGWRLLFGNGGVRCLAADGTELWHKPMVFEEAQHVVAGRFCADTEVQVAVIDRGFPRTIEGKPAVLYLFDLETGEEMWRREQLPGGWCAACVDIRWRGVDEFLDIAVYKRGVLDRGRSDPIAIYDGRGNIVDEIEVPLGMLDTDENVTRYPGDYYCYRADVWGDSCEELIISARNGVRIVANSRPLAIPTLYNSTTYNGM